MKMLLSDFDRLVERFYPAVFHLAMQVAPTPIEAMVLTNRIFKETQTSARSIQPQSAQIGTERPISMP